MAEHALHTPADRDGTRAQASVDAGPAMRLLARRLRAQPGDLETHRARLQAALALPGVEPFQGCMADLFHAVPPTQGKALRELACELAAIHLPAHMAAAFGRLLAAELQLEAVHGLATRWSVLVQPSAAVPARQRRGGNDESRRLAQRVVRAIVEGEAGASELEQEFLAHCQACDDKLAFMLARQALLRQGRELGADWEAVQGVLQQADDPVFLHE